MKRVLLLIGALALGGCLDTTAPKSSDPTTETFAPSLGVNILEMKVTTFGDFYKDLTVGTGAAMSAPNVSTTVTVDYTGYLSNGTLFDSGTNKTFTLGNLILGFADGLIGMNAGGERLIVIPSENGYGNTIQTTLTTTIPANSTLIFRVKLNSFQ